jgi:hypothetical protein
LSHPRTATASISPDATPLATSTNVTYLTHRPTRRRPQS